MSDINAKGGELRATLHITRKATGKVETLEIVGQTTPEQHAVLEAELRRIHEKRSHDAAGGLVGPGAGINQPDVKE